MRILFVLPYVPSLIRVRPYNFIRELASRHDVSLLATAATTRELEDADRLHTFCQTIDVVPFSRARGLRNCAAAAVRGEPLQAAVCRSPEIDRRLTHLLAARQIDVVHIEHLRAAHLGERIPGGLPTVFDSVDCISLLLERTLHSSDSIRQRVVAFLELRRTRAYEARHLPRFDRVAVTSASDAQALQNLAPSARVAVVPNGVDLEYFRPFSGPKEPATLVFSGKMSYHANATAVRHFAREIFPLVRKVRPDVRLRVVGSNPPPSVQALARDAAITVTGHVVDIRGALQSATVAICPVTVKVGIQNKILEAMAMGLPVVSTREGAEGLEANPGQDFLVAETPVQFADHVCRLLTDPHARDLVGSAGRHYVETHHRWDGAARRLETLYLDVTDRGTRSGHSSRHA